MNTATAEATLTALPLTIDAGRPGATKYEMFAVKAKYDRHKCYLMEFGADLEIMQSASMLCGDAETEEERTARLAFNASTPIVNGQVVTIAGRPGTYTVVIRGDYSDLGYLKRNA